MADTIRTEYLEGGLLRLRLRYKGYGYYPYRVELSEQEPGPGTDPQNQWAAYLTGRGWEIVEDKGFDTLTKAEIYFRQLENTFSTEA